GLAACRMPSNESLRDEKSDARPTAAPTAAAPAPTTEAASEAPKTPAGAPAAERSAAAPARSTAAPAARPAAPAPVKRIAEGTALSLVFETTASSDKSQAGDAVVAKLAADVKDGERVVLPAGAELRGEVLAAEGSGRVKGRARLAVAFMKLVVDGQTYDIQTSAIDVTAKAQKGRDAKIIGGAAGAGALIGAIAGGGKGAAKGAAIGGAAGGGAVLATKGKEVVFAAGSKHTVRLKTSVTLD
ncbi:MAG TPA: hypothetical protein VLL75_03805, partial [Vicinamibacteria bacterium]|nr:hypothetical protein [Vicinamibacteria bacterium]